MDNNYYSDKELKLYLGDAIKHYDKWYSPIVIISDGPYGISGYKGDAPTHDCLSDWYEPHIKKWSEKSTALTTLWFWNTEVGWATVHPTLVKNGWKYRSCHIWDKGKAHIAGNVNSKSIRKLPVVTEVCVQYTKEPSFSVNGKSLSMKQWLKYEWSRTGLPFTKTNEACGVKDAATRKYFTQSHLWYYPPIDAFEKIQQYANKYGKCSGKPYFSLDGNTPLTRSSWKKLRAKFNYCHGLTNVWQEPPVNGVERLKNGSKSIHMNQKPLKLMDLIIRLSSDKGDIVWEPFGGLCSGLVAAKKLKRKGFASEIDSNIFNHAIKRLEKEI